MQLEQRRAERGISFKEALNEAVRRGLGVNDEQARTVPPAATRPLNLGRRLIEDVDSVSEALPIAEGESFR